jgi:hypothetical protein
MWKPLICGGMLLLACAGTAQGAWPLAPINRQHPIRSGWYDIRGRSGRFGTHRGIDIVDDQTTVSPQAPPRGAHRVYAISGGVVWLRRRYSGVIRIGRWGYGHVLPRRKLGARVKPGEFIGWSIRGEWHIHITLFNRAHTEKINPLSPAGERNGLDPLRDIWPPEILATSYDPTSGELDAHIEDPHESPTVDSMVPGRMLDDVSPFALDVNGTRLWTAAHDPLPPIKSEIGPETVRNLLAPDCGADPTLKPWTSIADGGCLGERWWNLGHFSPGENVTVTAWDGFGNHTTAVVVARTGSVNAPG